MKSIKYLLTMFFAIPILTLFSSKAFANTDITLTDDTTNHVVNVSVAHGSEDLNSFAMDLIFSNNINIQNLDTGDLDCSMASEVVENGNKINILCISNADIAKNGTIAKITYEITDANEYYFYVDPNTLDISGTVGTIIDVNKPADVTTDITANSSDKTSNPSTLMDFVKEYYVYIVGVLVIALIIVLAGSFKKETPSQPQQE